MIDHSLADVEPQLSYPLLNQDFPDSFFIGYIIKNRYDEERLSISQKYNATRFSYATNNGVYRLFGVLKEASPNHKLISKLNSKETITICEYSNILNSCGLSCLTSFLHFSPGLYPIDSGFSNHFFPNVGDDFQEYRNDIPEFQRVGNIYTFTLINHYKK